MKSHLNIYLSDKLLAALDEYAIIHALNRSEAARLLLHRGLPAPACEAAGRPACADTAGRQAGVTGHEPYMPPALPNWQVEAWTALLRGLYGVRLVLTDAVKLMLKEAIANLDEREARVLRLRFGLDGPRHTLAEVGAAFGVNRQRAHQVEARAMRRVRKRCRTRGIWELISPQLEEEET